MQKALMKSFGTSPRTLNPFDLKDGGELFSGLVNLVQIVRML
jgi:hypothetical protein